MTLGPVETAFQRIAEKKVLAIALAGLLSLLARALLLPVLPVPRPAIQDEFSYLLAADTFAHGRLANPTPAFAEHFETLQELMRPVYASKYPPLSSLMMALGQRLTGVPWAGVWLSMGLLCSSLCWALQGWLPPVWAFAGTLVAVVHIGIASYWTESYWGGACAAIGGALLAGAIPRLIERPRASIAVTFAFGLAVLANTRPLEGLSFAVVCSTYLLLMLRRTGRVAALLRQGLLPIALVLVPVAACMGYYNFRITGHIFELPYVAHDRQYALVEPVLWDMHPRAAPVYSNPVLRDFWKADRDEKLSGHQEILKTHLWDLSIFLRFLLGTPLLIAALVVARPLWRDPVAKHALLIALFAYLAGPALDTRMWPHYAAAEAVLVYIVTGCGLRAMRNLRPGVEGRYLIFGVLLIFALTTAFGLLSLDNQRSLESPDFRMHAKHATADEQFQHQPGRHLVLVRYGPRHDLYEELVYNHADIDGSKVIWARSLGPQQDAELIRHYPDRDVWMLTENGGVTLCRYSALAARK